MDRIPAALGPAGTLSRVVLALVLGLPAAGCGGGPAPLRHTVDSPEAVARAVLDALGDGDRARLESFVVTEEEFRDRVWPELPASRRERNVPVDYAWSDLHQKSRAHLAQTLATHSGRRYELVGIRFLADTAAFRSFSVLRKAELTVRDEEGREEDLRLFGSVLAAPPEYKLFSYVVD